MKLLVQEYGTIVIGLDLSTDTLSEAHIRQTQKRNQPEFCDPSFSAFAKYDFAQEIANTSQTNTRQGPNHSKHTPYLTLDWLRLKFCQGTKSNKVHEISKTGK